MAYGRYIKKKAKQATKAVGKRYGISYGKKKGVQFKRNSVAKIAKDLMWVKSRLNAEKKFLDDQEAQEFNVGQVDGNGIGFYVSDITPNMSQGTGESQRVGNSVRQTGMVIHANFIKNIYAMGSRRLKMCVIRCTDTTTANPNIITDLFDNNPLTGLVDYHSNIDYTELKDRRYELVATKYIKLAPQNEGDGLNATNESPTASVKWALKMNQVLRYETDTINSPANIRYVLVVFCDNGNKNTTTDSTNSGVLVKGASTGVRGQYHVRHWYVDN